MLGKLKNRVAGFLTWHVVNPVLRELREALFQGIVERDLRRLAVQADFYPVGGAACYSLLYLLIRILTENRIQSIVELGSGESTRLIDRIRAPDAQHVCYEHDASWHTRSAGRLDRCDFRLRPLVHQHVESIPCDWYDNVALQDFDLLLVDGPIGVDRYSRIGCWNLIRANRKKDFVVILDDSGRPGETETLAFVASGLRGLGLEPHVRQLDSGTVPAIIGCGNLAHVGFYF